VSLDGPDGDALAAAAASVGMTLDPAAARRWIDAAASAGRDLALHPSAGVFGHPLSLLDFDPSDLPFLRALAAGMRAAGRPGTHSAIAIAGSAAQGLVQPFPGDCDFYERLHLDAADEGVARNLLASVLRETALRVMDAPDLVLIEVNMGAYPRAVVERGQPRAAGDSITWRPDDVQRGAIDVTDPEGRALTIAWDDVEAGAAWTYVGALAVDPGASRLALASNMLDVTWGPPGGAIVPLDGALDPCFQEVYLEADALPLVTRLLRAGRAGRSGDAQGAEASRYAALMRGEVRHHGFDVPDFCKCSKRLYNLCRATGELEAAAWVRELFDEPAACVYQVPGLLEAAAVAFHASQKVERAAVLLTLDRVAESVRLAFEPAEADAIERDLGFVRALAAEGRSEVIGGDVLTLPEAARVDAVRARCRARVNDYFGARLRAFPRAARLMDEIGQEGERRT
jgi:hypothetical protein